MSKPRKLERFNPGFSGHVPGWVIAWTELSSHTEIKSFRWFNYRRRAVPVEYWEIFFDLTPEYSIILN